MLFQACAKEGAKVIATDIQKDKLLELEASGERPFYGSHCSWEEVL